MNFKVYFLGLSKAERATYAQAAGTSAHYIHTHLINRYKTPRKKLMQNLANASAGVFTVADLTQFFYAVNKKVA